MKQKNLNYRAIVVFISAIISTFFTGSLLAHPEEPAHHKPLPIHANLVMRALAEDSLPPQNLAAMTTTACSFGFAGIYPCNNIDLEAFMPLSAIGGTNSNSAANDIWGWTDSQTGKEYAIIGRVFGTSFVDISDPTNPVYLGNLPTHGQFGSDWRDIKVYQDHAFIVSEASRHGMQVFDLAQLRNVAAPPVTFSETAHYNKNSSAHNIVINEDSGFAYIVGAAGKNSCNGGLHMVDINNPTNPVFAGCFSADGYTHDAQCVIYDGLDIDHTGKEICLNSNEDSITIVDVSNKSSPVQLSRTGYAGVGYTHQGWLTSDHTYFLLDDELDEINFGHNTRTRMWDVTDLDAPVLFDLFDNQTSSIDHNQYVHNGFTYQANYRSGLRVLDASNVAAGQLTEVAFFDIYPADDNAEFNAAWSNYPYFASGVVVVSGIEQGLYVLRPNLGSGDNPPDVTLTNPLEGANVSGIVNITANASDDNGVTEVEFFVDSISIGTDSNGGDGWSASWNTSMESEGAHSISAEAIDTIEQTGNDSNAVTVDNVANPTLHVGDLDGSSVLAGNGGKWSSTVTITVHDSSEIPVTNASVAGSWIAGASGSNACTTNASGQCAITVTRVKRNVSSVSFSVTGISHATLTYNSATNHDPDGDSNGTVISIAKP
jgi:choice-of-anchor B domain-containing protein